MALSISPIYQATLSYTQNQLLQQVGQTIISKAGTITGSSGMGSSLFLHRINIPQNMNITEVDLAMQLSFNATNNGQGTMSRSFVVYSFGNSTSLGSVSSISNSSSWTSGTSTAGVSSSLTQFQGGWTAPFAVNAGGLIIPLTFPSIVLTPGDYVIGHLMDVAQSISSWTLRMFGLQALSGTNFAVSVNGNTVSVLSNAGTLAASAFTASGSMSVLSTGGLSSASGFSASTAVNALSSAGLTSFGSVHFISHTNVTGGKTLGASGTNGALSGLSSAITVTLVTNFTSGSFHTASGSGAAMSSGGLVTGSFFTSSAIASVMSSSGLLAGSFFTSVATAQAVTNVGTTFSSGGLQTTANFGYIGTGSTTSGFPTAFFAGIMSTGAIPTAITLTSTAVTYSGPTAMLQPWFALVGS